MKPSVWAELLDALLEERAELDLVIKIARRRVEGGSVRDRIGDGANGAGSSQPYHGLSINEAARRYLREEGRAKTTKEVCDALMAGGLGSRSTNLAATIYGSLRRTTDIKRVRNKWKLSDAASSAEAHETH